MGYSLIYVRRDAAGAGHTSVYQISRATEFHILYSGKSLKDLDDISKSFKLGHGDLLVLEDDRVEAFKKSFLGEDED